LTEDIRRFGPVVRLAILDYFIPGDHQVQPHYGVRTAQFKLIFTTDFKT